MREFRVDEALSNGAYAIIAAVASAAAVRSLFPLLAGLVVQVVGGVLTAGLSVLVVWRLKKVLKALDERRNVTLPAEPRPASNKEESVNGLG